MMDMRIKEVAMQKIKPTAAIIVLNLLVFVLAFAAETLIVKVQTTQLRKGPQFFSPAVAALKAGDRLEKMSESSGWIQVKTPGGVLGWIHSSAVEATKFNLLAMDKSMKTQATASEVALAGKGFNKQVEASYRAKHAEANFALVDQMLLLKIAPAQIEEFLKKGKLGESRGAK
jgi:uncharacterized protein YgiM (DUF1202 family)